MRAIFGVSAGAKVAEGEAEVLIMNIAWFPQFSLSSTVAGFEATQGGGAF